MTQRNIHFVYRAWGAKKKRAFVRACVWEVIILELRCAFKCMFKCCQTYSSIQSFTNRKPPAVQTWPPREFPIVMRDPPAVFQGVAPQILVCFSQALLFIKRRMPARSFMYPDNMCRGLWVLPSHLRKGSLFVGSCQTARSFRGRRKLSVFKRALLICGFTFCFWRPTGRQFRRPWV